MGRDTYVANNMRSNIIPNTDRVGGTATLSASGNIGDFDDDKEGGRRVNEGISLG